MITRRRLLQIAATGSALFACGSPGTPVLTCTDTASLTDAERQMRSAQNYTDQAAQEGRSCKNCNFYQARGANECGGCTVIKGPIHPNGTCSLFASR